MQSIMRLVVALFLLSSVIASSYYRSTMLRVDGVLYVYPFPTRQLPQNDLYLDYEPAEGRQNPNPQPPPNQNPPQPHLYPFPRIGRSAPSLIRGEAAHEYQPSGGVRRTESL